LDEGFVSQGKINRWLIPQVESEVPPTCGAPP